VRNEVRKVECSRRGSDCTIGEDGTKKGKRREKELGRERDRIEEWRGEERRGEGTKGRWESSME